MLPIDWPTPPGTGEDQMMVVETMGPIAPGAARLAMRVSGMAACQRSFRTLVPTPRAEAESGIGLVKRRRQAGTA